jgi:predicted N-acetyltransferase YhbS
MFQIVKMEPEHFPAVVELANTMDWHMTEEDFAFNSLLEPDGALVLLDDDKVVGAATCISYGTVGWFGNLIVDSHYRKHGLGRQVLEQALRVLQAQGVATVGLYAYLHLVNFYGAVGFVRDVDFVVLKAHKVKAQPSSVANVKRLSAEMHAQIVGLDAHCFGASRQRLFQTILGNPSNPCYGSFDGVELVGFVAAKVYDGAAELGPLACKPGRSQTAQSLLTRLLQDLEGNEAYLYLPASESALLQLAQQAGFTEQFRLARMFFGPPVAARCIYSAESLERG